MALIEVAFFGGSFDPPHFGHLLAAAYARGAGFDRVLVAPVRAHAFGKRLNAFEHRVAMARLAFESIDGVEVSEIEAELPEPNFTLNTLQALASAHPDWRLRLMVGSDVMADASKWNRFDEVRRLAPPFVLGRAGGPQQAQAGLQLAEVSSTDVRKALGRRHDDESIAEWLGQRVPKPVLGYIEKHGLYR
jgi:nicotinate-nucleotide adenylyltransferase